MCLKRYLNKQTLKYPAEISLRDFLRAQWQTKQGKTINFVQNLKQLLWISNIYSDILFIWKSGILIKET